MSASVAPAEDPLERWPYPDWLAEHADNPGFEWARKAWTRSAAYPDAWFDAAKADAVVAKWPTWFKLTEDRFAGKPFRLAAWQAVIVRLIFGWKVPVPVNDEDTDELRIQWVRLIRRLRLWIPRKNGKSEFLAALGLAVWAYDAIVRAPGFVFARKEKQAKVIFDKMKAMIGYSAELGEGVTPFTKSLFLKKFFSAFELLPGTADGAHGGSPYVVLGDEMHEWKPAQAELADTLRRGMGVRLQPLEAHASTAGIKSNFTGKSLFDEDQKRLDGRLDDPRTLVCIFTLDPEADPFDELNWFIANPSLGRSINIDFMRTEAAEAKGNPRAEANFRCYHLNQWVDGVSRWLPIKKWDACSATKDGWTKYPESLKGRLCYGAIDLANTRDITAFVLVFPPCDDDPKWRCIARFWVPELVADERVKIDGVPYDKWIGHNGGPALETTEGDSVDQDAVGAAIVEAKQLYDLQQVAYDPWSAHKLITDLQKDHGIDAEFFAEFRQGIRSYAEPSRFFERLVFTGAFDHGGHPVLRWMAQNVVVKFDDNLNFMPHKLKSGEKIDGIAAAVMATGLAMGEGEGDTPSYLEDEDVMMM